MTYKTIMFLTAALVFVIAARCEMDHAHMNAVIFALFGSTFTALGTGAHLYDRRV